MTKDEAIEFAKYFIGRFNKMNTLEKQLSYLIAHNNNLVLMLDNDDQYIHFTDVRLSEGYNTFIENRDSNFNKLKISESLGNSEGIKAVLEAMGIACDFV